MGTGTTAEVAAKFFCHFIGNDFCKTCLEITKDRLSKYEKEEQ